jgi:hypothetical protein
MSALCQKRTHAVQHKSAELGTAPGKVPRSAAKSFIVTSAGDDPSARMVCFARTSC